MVVTIIGILLAVGIPNFLAAQERAKVAAVKANMHGFQTMVELYGTSWSAVYPNDISQLYTEANLAGHVFWRDFENPTNGRTGLGEAFSDDGGTLKGGIITYVPGDPVPVSKYYIYGYDSRTVRIQENGHDFTLTNS